MSRPCLEVLDIYRYRDTTVEHSRARSIVVHSRHDSSAVRASTPRTRASANSTTRAVCRGGTHTACAAHTQQQCRKNNWSHRKGFVVPSMHADGWGPWIGLEKFRAAYTRAAAILSASTLAYRPRRLQPGAPGICVGGGGWRGGGGGPRTVVKFVVEL